MGIASFFSPLYNFFIVLLPIAAMTLAVTFITAREQGRTFWKLLPYTVVASIALTGEMLVVLGDRLRPSGVAATSAVSAITWRPSILLLVLAAISIFSAGRSRRASPRQRLVASHIAIALALSAATQCAVGVFAPAWYFDLANVHVGY